RVRMEDLRTRVRVQAAIELPGGDAGDRIVTHAPGLRRLGPRKLPLRVLRSRQPRRLREADVERAAVRRLVRNGAIEHPVPVLVLVEAELDERANPASALRRAVDDGVLD